MDKLFWLLPRRLSALRKLVWLKLSGAAAEIWRTITAAVATFTAVAAPLRQLSVAFSPVQDLHGYDAPWPGGGGKNKLQVTATTQTINGVTFTVNDDGSVNVNGTATANAVFILNSYDFDGTAAILNGCPTGGSVSTFKLDAFGASGLSEDIGYGVTISVSGTRAIRIIVFSGTTMSNAVFKPMLRLASVADATFAPYSNICPISGWSSLTVEQRGKNLFSGEKLANASISASGTLESNNSNDVLIARVFDGETYTFSLNPNGVTVGGLFTDYPTMDSVTYNNARLYLSGSESYTYTIPQGVKYIGVRYLKTFTEYQIVLGSTLPAEYTPYNPSSRSISITIGQTVYGGTLDVLSGKMTVTWAKKTLNGSEDWGGTPRGWWVQENNLKKLTSYVGHMLADTLPAGALGENRLYGYIDINNSYPGENWIYYKNSALASKAEVIAFFAANPTEVVYDLATPFELTLTPEQISTLQGTNNVWSDAGDVTVEYRAQ